VSQGIEFLVKGVVRPAETGAFIFCLVQGVRHLAVDLLKVNVVVFFLV
jgi:hypothetical protein